MPAETVPSATVAEAALAMLAARGVERLYVNGGTDFAPVAEAYARAAQAGLSLPAPVVVPHENVAVGMAHGAYMASRKPQAVMVHVSVGTANAVMGLMNAARDRAPVLLLAGRTPLFERDALGARNGNIHWGQEMFDQAGMLRELVKWDYELRDGLQLEAVLDRALNVAMTEPRGPVYLTLPREVLARPLDHFTFAAGGPAPATPPGPAPYAVDELADMLASARLPVIVASAAAAEPGFFRALDELARTYAIGIAENVPRYVNASSAHPLHLGYGTGSLFGDADVLCFAESDVPWIPAAGDPPADTTIVHLGVDPLFSRYPIRSYRSDLAVTGSCRYLLEALGPALQSRRQKIDPDRYERIAKLASQRRAQQQADLAARAQASTGITKAFMNWTLAEARPADAIVVDEYWAAAGNLRPTVEGSEFHSPPAGGLGWGLPAALGVQIESPGRTVIATVGDGAYLFSNPPACHHVAARNRLPVITVICNNGRWGAVEGSARAMYPDGHTARAGSSPLAELDRSHPFEQDATATGGHGERVTEREQLKPALQRALDIAAHEQRHVVLNVSCDD